MPEIRGRRKPPRQSRGFSLHNWISFRPTPKIRARPLPNTGSPSGRSPYIRYSNSNTTFLSFFQLSSSTPLASSSPLGTMWKRRSSIPILTRYCLAASALE